MTTDNTMTLAYENVKKAQTQITTKDYKLRIAYQRLQTKDGPIDKRPFKNIKITLGQDIFAVGIS